MLRLLSTLRCVIPPPRSPHFSHSENSSSYKVCSHLPWLCLSLLVPLSPQSTLQPLWLSYCSLNMPGHRQAIRDPAPAVPPPCNALPLLDTGVSACEVPVLTALLKLPLLLPLHRSFPAPSHPHPPMVLTICSTSEFADLMSVSLPRRSPSRGGVFCLLCSLFYPLAQRKVPFT